MLIAVLYCTVILCIEIFRQSNTRFEECNNFVLKWDGMLPILKDWSDERLECVEILYCVYKCM